MYTSQWCNPSLLRFTSAISSTLHPLLSDTHRYKLLNENIEDSRLKPTTLAFNYINYLHQSNKNEYIQEEDRSLRLFGIFSIFSCWQTPNIKTAVHNLLDSFEISRATLEDAKIWHKLGLILFDFHLYNESELCYNTSLKIFPNNIEVIYHKGVLRQITGHKIAALKLFEKVTDLCRNLTSKSQEAEKQLISAIFHIGVLHLQLNQIEEAKKKFYLILENDENNTAVLVLLADCLERELKYADAASLLKRALDLDPNDFRIKKNAEHVSLLAARTNRISNTNDGISTACPTE